MSNRHFRILSGPLRRVVSVAAGHQNTFQSEDGALPRKNLGQIELYACLAVWLATAVVFPSRTLSTSPHAPLKTALGLVDEVRLEVVKQTPHRLLIQLIGELPFGAACLQQLRRMNLDFEAQMLKLFILRFDPMNAFVGLAAGQSDVHVGLDLQVTQLQRTLTKTLWQTESYTG